jgi:glycogen operon protein
MIYEGTPEPLGSVCREGGVNFAVYAGSAERVELCLYTEDRREAARHFLPGHDKGVWHGFLPGAGPGQRYGYRVHGPWSPEDGLRHNPAKLLIDPYAQRLDGAFRWHPAVYDFVKTADPKEWRRSDLDSAPHVPLSVVVGPGSARDPTRPRIPWTDTIIYEANVRGFTMRFPGLPESERGGFRGLSNGRIVEHLHALGVTSLELMPVHSFIDEAFLAERGQRNLWGYNSIQFFTPDARFVHADGAAEFREMVDAIHDAGIEVILDVVYNHTGEGATRGPTVSFRGLDNLAYYRTRRGDPSRYINDSGCGNSINADHPRVQQLVRDSLRYWHREMGVDGFRFDLATLLGRGPNGFRTRHRLLQLIGSDPELDRAKLIAEPWDPGPGGYQLGGFPEEWAEWNDRYRDTVRRFWRGDPGQGSEFARRIHGSADLFERNGRHPSASINFVTSHDGFTLRDLVSYARKHNEDNGEKNRDGHAHNFSSNHGAEGDTEDPQIHSLRRRQRLNLLATLLFSQGTPMLLAGDEAGNSQGGNNNAYAQDNETGWVDWSGLNDDPEFTQRVRELVHLRKRLPLLHLPRYLHGPMPTDSGWCDIGWLHPDGRPMNEGDWNGEQRLVLLFSCHPLQDTEGSPEQATALLFNASETETEYRLPSDASRAWQLRFFSCDSPPRTAQDGCWLLPARTIALVTSGHAG